MKLSKFNLELKFENFICIYNTLSDSLTFVKEDIYQKSKNDSENLGMEFNQRLIEQGILLKDGMNELEIYRFRTRKQRYKNAQTHLFLTVTDSCNCRCPYCFEQKQTTKGTMRASDFLIINQFIKKQVKQNKSELLHIDFFGGEPFLCEDIIFQEMDELLKLSKELQVALSIQFYTNGTIKLKRGFEALKGYPISNILVTLDGIKTIHDSMRPLANGNSSYDCIMNNIHELISLSIPVSLRINFDKESYNEIPSLLQELKSNGFGKIPIQFYPIQNMSHGCAGYSGTVSLTELEAIMPKLWQYAKNYECNVPLKPNVANIYCSAFCSSSFMIDPNLDVHKCVLLQCDEKYRIANLKENIELNDESYYYQWMNRDSSLIEECQDCISLPICSGGCGGAGTFKNGTHLIPNCYELSPQLLEKRLYFYILNKYTKKIKEFVQSNEDYFILEKAKFKNIWW